MKNIFLMDVDMTLLNFEASERVALSRALEINGVTPTDELIGAYHDINDSLWKRLERKEIEPSELKDLRFCMLYEKFSLKGDPYKTSEDYFVQLSQTAIPFDGMEDFLKSLKRRGRVYLVTNGSTVVQKGRFAKSGLFGLSDGVFISQEIGVNKPSVEYGKYVEEHIEDFIRENAVWVGDSISSDKGCADVRGIDFILFDHDDKMTGYEGVRVRSYAELLDVLDLM